MKRLGPSSLRVLRKWGNPLNWQIVAYDQGIAVEDNAGTGWVDWPVMYKDESIAYDRPHPIPQHVKQAVRHALVWLHSHRQLCNWEEEHAHDPKGE